jgi:hypothetical protein
MCWQTTAVISDSSIQQNQTSRTRVSLVSFLIRKTQGYNIMSNFPKTITLNDGRTLTISRKPKVKDMKQVRRALAGDELKDEFNLTLHMIARVCQIDGNPTTVETIEDFDFDELPEIVEAIFEGNVPTAASPILT